MTQPNPATKTRADVAKHLREVVELAQAAPPVVSSAEVLYTTLTTTRISLWLEGYQGDAHWLAAHLRPIARADHPALMALALRTIEHLAISETTTTATPEETIVALVEEVRVLRQRDADQVDEIASLHAQLDIKAAIEASPCPHSVSLFGRCTACGMTWDQQAIELAESEHAQVKAVQA